MNQPENAVAVFHCPHCHEPIGSVRLYKGKGAGRPNGAVDSAPRKERRGDINKAIAKELRERQDVSQHDAQCERVQNEQNAAALPHADASEAEASFAFAVGSGWIDQDGKVLCGCAARRVQG